MQGFAGPSFRFTRAGSTAFDDWMAARVMQLSKDVRRALGDNLVALVLGGGYGRGEGGVVWARAREAPYNDLDLVVVVRRKRGVPALLAPVAAAHEHALGIAVDFSRPLTVSDIEGWEHRLRWHDLCHGHVVLWGDPRLLERHAPPGIVGPVSLAEASRLLLNRGAGLVWARRILRGCESAPDPDFVRRNAYKAFLAIGDAYLIAAGLVSRRHAGRLELLREHRRTLPAACATEILDRYADALTFKFTPGLLPGGAPCPSLLGEAADLWMRTYLDVEGRRFGRAWPSHVDYARWPGTREPEPPGRGLANLLRNLRHFSLSRSSPREPLYRQLPALLGDGPQSEAWQRDSGRFIRLWQRVND